jgi:hypothetical protein
MKVPLIAGTLDPTMRGHLTSPATRFRGPSAALSTCIAGPALLQPGASCSATSRTGRRLASAVCSGASEGVPPAFQATAERWSTRQQRPAALLGLRRGGSKWPAETPAGTVPAGRSPDRIAPVRQVVHLGLGKAHAAHLVVRVRWRQEPFGDNPRGADLRY